MISNYILATDGLRGLARYGHNMVGWKNSNAEREEKNADTPTQRLTKVLERAKDWSNIVSPITEAMFSTCMLTKPRGPFQLTRALSEPYEIWNSRECESEQWKL